MKKKRRKIRSRKSSKSNTGLLRNLAIGVGTLLAGSYIYKNYLGGMMGNGMTSLPAAPSGVSTQFDPTGTGVVADVIPSVPVVPTATGSFDASPSRFTIR